MMLLGGLETLYKNIESILSNPNIARPQSTTRMYVYIDPHYGGNIKSISICLYIPYPPTKILINGPIQSIRACERVIFILDLEVEYYV